jgi:hypothetical protein
MLLKYLWFAEQKLMKIYTQPFCFCAHSGENNSKQLSVAYKREKEITCLSNSPSPLPFQIPSRDEKFSITKISKIKFLTHTPSSKAIGIC